MRRAELDNPDGPRETTLSFYCVLGEAFTPDTQ